MMSHMYPVCLLINQKENAIKKRSRVTFSSKISNNFIEPADGEKEQEIGDDPDTADHRVARYKQVLNQGLKIGNVEVQPVS